MPYWGVTGDDDASDAGDGNQGSQSQQPMDTEDDDVFFQQTAAVNRRKTVDEIVDDLRRFQLPIGVTPQQVNAVISSLAEEWLDSKPDLTQTTYFEWICERAGLPTTPHTQDEHTPLVVERAFDQISVVLLELIKLCELTKDGSDHMLSTATENGIARRDLLSRLFNTIHHSKRFLIEHAAMTSHFDANTFSSLTLEETMITPLSLADSAKDHQIVENYVLDKLASLGYRLNKESCYESILNSSGVPTFAWRKKCTVKEFIAREVTVEKCFSVYQAYTANGSYTLCSRLADFLIESSVQSRFKKIIPDRNIIAFRNGIFSALNVAFYPFDCEEEWDDITEVARLRLSGYDAAAEGYVVTPNRTDHATLKYFDIDFSNWQEINDVADLLSIDVSVFPTPHLDSIFEYQRLTEETISNMYALLGRLFFETGRFDDFQVALVIKGVAGAGKSLITGLIADCFDPSRVVALGSNMQREFGWEGCEDADLVTIFELSRKTSMDQKILQSAISGELVPITRKGQKAITLRFLASFLMSGNELPEWRDASNSMGRRIVLVPFNRTVVNQNEELSYLLREELACILPKLIVSYRQICVRAEKRGFWGRLPSGEYIASQQLRDTKQELMSELQPLVAHILRSQRYMLCWSDDSLVRSETFVPESVFLDSFRSWCREYNVGFPTWNADTYATVFETYQIERRVDSVVWCGDSIRENVLFGISLRV